MNSEFIEGFWLHGVHSCSLREICEFSGLDELELREWVDAGIITPADPDHEPWTFGADCLLTIRTVCRVRQDFELDLNSAALVMSLLERVRLLEQELGELRARLPQVHG